LIGGKQAALGLETIATRESDRYEIMAEEIVIRQRPAPLAPRITDAELAAHAMMVKELGDKAIWLQMGSAEVRPQ
jgi:DNA polymerase III subunit epsilon